MILGHIGVGFVIKTKNTQIPLLLLILFSILPEIFIPGVLFAPFLINQIQKLGFVEYAMRCSTSIILISILSGLIILISIFIKKIRLGTIFALCMVVSIILNAFVEAYWIFPINNYNMGLGIYPWNPVFWIIDIIFSSLCISYYIWWRKHQ